MNLCNSPSKQLAELLEISKFRKDSFHFEKMWSDNKTWPII